MFLPYPHPLSLPNAIPIGIERRRRRSFPRRPRTLRRGPVPNPSLTLPSPELPQQIGHRRLSLDDVRDGAAGEPWRRGGFFAGARVHR
jgi:hypothetical protein